MTQPATRNATAPLIDANMHWLPENLFADEPLLAAFLGSVPTGYGIHARLSPVPGKALRQIVIEQPKGHEVLNYAENQYSAAGQIADMDRAGIDMAVLRMPCWQEWLDLDACRKANLRLVHSMLGGAFFALADMLVPPGTGKDAVDRFDDEGARIRRYLKENVYFDLSGAPQWGKAELECAVKVLGADHILYGGSYPIRRDWFQEGIGYVRDLAMSDTDKALILGGNARALFRLG